MVLLFSRLAILVGSIRDILMMRQILFATGNPSKAQRFSRGLSLYDIEVVSMSSLNLCLQVNENGKTAVENARIKARVGYLATGMPTLGMDDALYLDNVPENEQPGLYVRRVNGKVMNDEQMLTHYISLVKRYGCDGRLNAKWVYGLVLIDHLGKEWTFTWTKENFYFVPQVSSVIHPGYPLNSISKYRSNDRYFTDIPTSLNKDDEHDVITFIVQHV